MTDKAFYNIQNDIMNNNQKSSLYAYEPVAEHIYAEMVTLYKKVFMNIE